VPLTPTADVVSSACRDGRAVGAFNVITLEHAEAVVTGAEAVGCPVICQISENAVRFHGGRFAPMARATAALTEAAAVPVALHLDHVTDEGLLRRPVDCGFGSVMFDASALSHAENVVATRVAARWAHAQGLWLEAELGEIGGKDGVGGGGRHGQGQHRHGTECRLHRRGPRHTRRGARDRRPPVRPHRGAPGDGRCRDVGPGQDSPCHGGSRRPPRGRPIASPVMYDSPETGAAPSCLPRQAAGLPGKRDWPRPLSSVHTARSGTQSQGRSPTVGGVRFGVRAACTWLW
jgi:hypothetical protein